MNDIFNADEFRLYYFAAPTTTIGPGPLFGQKKSKQRITFLVYANVDDTEFMPPLMIGKACRPCCFGGADPSELGLEYDYAGKAWINTTIFFRLLKRFDSNITHTPNRKVSLFIDNCTARGSTTNLPELPHVRVELLPKNTTSILQPLDQRVIACVKQRYKQLTVQRAVDMIDAGHTENLYKIGLLLARIWVYDIWERMHNDIIYDCWCKSSIV